MREPSWPEERHATARRVCDVVIALATLGVLGPLMAAVALVIRFSSPGPVIFRARRVGRHGIPFEVLKFRTMRVGAERVGPGITRAGDPRVTRVGAWLRRTKMDELPQLFNVLRGDMSLVGPRPEDPRYVERYSEGERLVLATRPGITGAASLRYRDEERLLKEDDWEDVYCRQIMPDKLRIELEYLQRRTLGSDLALIGETLIALLPGRGRSSASAPVEAARSEAKAASGAFSADASSRAEMHGPQLEWIAVVLAAPILMFPTRAPLLALLTLASVPLLWVAETWWGRGWRARSATTVPAAALLLASVCGCLISPFPMLSFEKFCGMALGLWTLRAVPAAVRTRATLELAAGALLAAVTLFTVAGLLGTELNNKFLPAWATDWVPRLIPSVPTRQGAVNANALGATTLLCAPLAVAMAALACKRQLFLQTGRLRWLQPELQRLIAAAAPWALSLVVGLLLGVLLLSQSLTCWIAAAGTGMAAVAVARRRLRWVMGVAVLSAGAAVFVAMRPALLTDFAAPSGVVAAGGELSLRSRVEIWSRALDAIADFPVTGVGLNAFRRLVPVMYPLRSVPPETDVAHAHNVFLQTALDVGAPGLSAYVAILLVGTTLAWRTWGRGDVAERWLALGLWGNLLAAHLFGVTDAIALGAKIGLFVWWNVGLIVALHQLTPALGPSSS